MPSEKLFTARQATLAVLNKVETLLKNSDLTKYETSNSSKLGYKLPETGKKEIYPQSEDKKFNGQAHVEHQKAPGNNPKEKAEGNNPDRDALPKDLGKSEQLAKKYYGFKAVEEKAKESGASNPAAVAASAGRKKYGKEAFQHAAAKGKKMGKAENPDKDADAELGEKVENDVEQHMEENKEAEQQEGHKMAKDGKSYPQNLASKNIEAHMKHKERHPGGAKQAEAIGIEQARHGEHEMDKHSLSADQIKGHLKLAKFMGRMEHKRSLKKNDGMI